MASLQRRQQSAAASEARRKTLCAPSEEPAEIIELTGRSPEKKNANRIMGAYQRVHDPRFEIIYQKLDADTGKFSDGFIIRKRRSWKVVDSPAAEGKHMAFNKDISCNCPTKLQLPWVCYNGKEAKDQQDADLKATEIPLGFVPVAPPKDELHQIISEGVAAGTPIKAAATLDESQVRKWSPRPEIHLPRKCKQPVFKTGKAFFACRVRWLDEVLENGNTARDDIWAKYKALMGKLTTTLQSTYFFFVAAPANARTIWYKKVGDGPAPEEMNQAEEEALSALDSITQQGRRDAEARQPAEVDQLSPKRQRVAATVPGVWVHVPAHLAQAAKAKDPWMQLISHSVSEDRAQPLQPGSSGKRPREAKLTQALSSLEFDAELARRFFEVMKGDLETCKTVLTGTTWYKEALNVDSVSLTQPDCDAAWLWMMALLASKLSTSAGLHPRSVLDYLARSSVGTCQEVRQALARSLVCCRWLPGVDSCLTPADMLQFAITCSEQLQQERAFADDGPTLKSLQVLKDRGFTVKTAQVVFRPKKQFDTTTCMPLVVAAYGILLVHWLSNRGDAVFGRMLSSLRERVCSYTDTGLLWSCLCCLYIGCACQLRGVQACLEEVAADRVPTTVRAELLQLSGQETHTTQEAAAMIASDAANTEKLKLAESVNAATAASVACKEEEEPMTIQDLCDGAVAPWTLQATVVRKTQFQTGSGFHITAQDKHGSKMGVFFFREAASLHDSKVDVGNMLTVSVPSKSRQTYVRKADPRYGGGFQLVIGKDARVDCRGAGAAPRLPAALARLPAPGFEVTEAFAVVVSVSEHCLTKGGDPYRRLLIADETTDAAGLVGVDLYLFGAKADLPDGIGCGVVVRLSQAVVHELNSPKILQNAGISVALDRSKARPELLQWAKQAFPR